MIVNMVSLDASSQLLWTMNEVQVTCIVHGLNPEMLID